MILSFVTCALISSNNMSGMLRHVARIRPQARMCHTKLYFLPSKNVFTARQKEIENNPELLEDLRDRNNTLITKLLEQNQCNLNMIEQLSKQRSMATDHVFHGGYLSLKSLKNIEGTLEKSAQDNMHQSTSIWSVLNKPHQSKGHARE